MANILEPLSVSDYVADGVRIAAILLIWGLIAVFFSYGVTEITKSFERIFTQLGETMTVVGLFNAFLYIFYRTVDYWHETT